MRGLCCSGPLQMALRSNGSVQISRVLVMQPYLAGDCQLHLVHAVRVYLLIRQSCAFHRFTNIVYRRVFTPLQSASMQVQVGFVQSSPMLANS